MAPVGNVAVSKRSRRSFGIVPKVFFALFIWIILWVIVIGVFFVARQLAFRSKSCAFMGMIHGQYVFDYTCADDPDFIARNPIARITNVPDKRYGPIWTGRDPFSPIEITVTPTAFTVSAGTEGYFPDIHKMGEDVVYVGDGTFVFRECARAGYNMPIIPMPTLDLRETVTRVIFRENALEVTIRSLATGLPVFGFFEKSYKMSHPAIRVQKPSGHGGDGDE